MYFSQLVSTMRNPTIAVAVAEDGGEIQYTGELFNLPFFLFRRWHDYKVLEITPMYATDEKKPFMRIEIEYAEREKK